jgi:hypothetical protein
VAHVIDLVKGLMTIHQCGLAHRLIREREGKRKEGGREGRRREGGRERGREGGRERQRQRKTDRQTDRACVSVCYLSIHMCAFGFGSDGVCV